MSSPSYLNISNIGEAQTLIKQQITQIKLLTNDNQIKTQQTEILKEKVHELEEFSSIYKKQVTNLESKLKLYDQELNLKFQANADKHNKMLAINTALNSKNNHHQLAIGDLENNLKCMEEELTRAYEDNNELKNKLNFQEDKELKSNANILNKDIEIVNLQSKLKKNNEEIQQIHLEFNTLREDYQNIHEENERMLKLLEDNDLQLRKFANYQKMGRELQQQYELQVSENNYLKSTLEASNKKYEELFYDYNLLVLNKKHEIEEEQN